VILISEGPSSRVGHMLANERKKTARWVPDIPIYEIQVGEEADQVSLMKLQKTLSKLPRNLRGGEVTEVRRRLDALGNAQGSMPIPKGPVPTSARQVRHHEPLVFFAIDCINRSFPSSLRPHQYCYLP
jgi:Domain of unknown function (DUF4191)